MVRSTQPHATLVAALLAGLSLSSPALVSAEGSRLRGGGNGDNDAAVVDILKVTPTKNEGVPSIPVDYDEEDLMLADPFQHRMLENHDHLGAVPLDGMLEHQDFEIDDEAFLDPFGEGDRFLLDGEDMSVTAKEGLNGKFDRRKSDGRRGGDTGDSLVDKRIVKGSAARKDFKAMCITMKKGADGQYFKGHCGCTVIGRKWVLLAAHCHSNLRPGDLARDLNAIYANPVEIYKRDASGKANNGHPFQIKDIKQCRKHPKHRAQAAAPNDIMVCELVSDMHPTILNDIPHVASESYMASSMRAGKSCTVVGMGQTAYGAAHSLTNLQVDVGFVPHDECCESMCKWGLDNSMMCAGGRGAGDACGGDSGGPAYTRENGLRCLVGVVSWGYRCDERGYPGVYSKVSAHLSWIRSVVGANQGLKIASGSGGGNGNSVYNGASYNANPAPAPAPTPKPQPAPEKPQQTQCSNSSGSVSYWERKKNKPKTTTCAKVADKPGKYCKEPVAFGSSEKVGDKKCCAACR